MGLHLSYNIWMIKIWSSLLFCSKACFFCGSSQLKSIIPFGTFPASFITTIFMLWSKDDVDNFKDKKNQIIKFLQCWEGCGKTCMVFFSFCLFHNKHDKLWVWVPVIGSEWSSMLKINHLLSYSTTHRTNWTENCRQFHCLLNVDLIKWHTSCIIPLNNLLISEVRIGSK